MATQAYNTENASQTDKPQLEHGATARVTQINKVRPEQGAIVNVTKWYTVPAAQTGNVIGMLEINFKW